MLLIDFDDKKIDIQEKIKNALNLLLTTTINLSIINQLLETKQITNLPEYTFERYLSFGNINRNFYYSDELEKKHGIQSTHLYEILEDAFEKRKIDSDNDELLIACKESIIEHFKVEYGVSTASDLDILDVYRRDIDILEGDFAEVLEIIELVKNSSNSLKKNEIILSSYSRTLCSYLDSLSREFVGAIFSNSHYYLCKLLRDKKDYFKVTNDKTESIISSSILGKKLKNTIIDFYGLSEKENAELHNKYAGKIEEIDLVISSRNEIMHRYNPNKVHYNRILYKWGQFGRFYNEIHEDHNYEDRDGTNFLLKKCLEIMNEVSCDYDYVSKKLIPFHMEQCD